ncbi:MAG: hypothetical protein M1821_009182 [Bathelium mastoideum]|nr:MAG: hypothetical protein M1821_009182 [Bathelium mastoideum]
MFAYRGVPPPFPSIYETPPSAQSSNQFKSPFPAPPQSEPSTTTATGGNSASSFSVFSSINPAANLPSPSPIKAAPSRPFRHDPDVAARLRAEWEAQWAGQVMPPPPPGLFDSREEMIETAKKFTREHGFDLVIGHSTKKHGEFARCWLICELAGEYRNRHRLQPEDRKRKRESRKTNCPFKLLGSKKRHETRWLLSIKDGRHNHDLISKPNQEEVGEADFPELEVALYQWHKEAISQNNDASIHGNTLKAKALEFWHAMPEYQNLEPPEFDAEWVKLYRRRHGFPVKMITKSKNAIASNVAMSSDNAQRLIDATNTPTSSSLVDPALGEGGSSPQLPVSATQLIQTLPANDQALIASIAAHVHTEMRFHDASHDFAHITRVLSLSLSILSAEQRHQQFHLTAPPTYYDPTALVLAALLHDLADRKYLPASATASTSLESLVATTLLDRGCPDALALKVQMIARHVSWAAERANPRMVRAVVSQHPELAVVQDADRLDALGAVGIGRAFTFGGARTRGVEGTAAGVSAGRGLEETVGHFGEKLEKLEGMMKTDTGRRMARERTERLSIFKQWWQEELALAN